MKPEEVAAYVGAAAWLPQIIHWGYNYFVRPKLTISIGRQVEIGFTNLGPIFNVPLAFSVANKDLILDKIEVSICHQGGECHDLTWHGLGETFSEITDNHGNKQTVGKNQSAPIAIKVSTIGLFEKSVRFQDPIYHKENRQLMDELKDHARYLYRKDSASAASELFSSKQYIQLHEKRLKHFYWKAGRYSVRIKASSQSEFVQITPNFEFDLSDSDINLLSVNCQLIGVSIQNDLGKGNPEYRPEPTKWRWVYVNRIE